MMFFTFAYKPYIVIIGDIINSRKIEKRGEVQEKLKQILRDINEKYKEDIASKIYEFQNNDIAEQLDSFIEETVYCIMEKML